MGIITLIWYCNASYQFDTEPTTGQFDLYGRVGSLLEVEAGFYPELTGRENFLAGRSTSAIWFFLRKLAYDRRDW